MLKEEQFAFLNEEFGITAEKLCHFLPLGTYLFHLCVPRKHPLADKMELRFHDMCWYEITMLKAGVSPINDQMRQKLQENDVSVRDAEDSAADSVLEAYRPVGLISVERCGRDAEGIYANMRHVLPAS